MNLKSLILIIFLTISFSKLPFNTMRQRIVALFALVGCGYYFYFQEIFYPIVLFVISIVLNITDRTVDYAYLLICIFMVITLYYYPMSLPVKSSTDSTSD